MFCPALVVSLYKHHLILMEKCSSWGFNDSVNGKQRWGLCAVCVCVVTKSAVCEEVKNRLVSKVLNS